MFIVKKSLIYLTIISLLWQALVYFFNIPTYILPSPIDIFVSFSNNHMLILRNLGITILEILTGFLLANLASLMLVCVACYDKRIEDIIFPVSIIIKTIPIIYTNIDNMLYLTFFLFKAANLFLLIILHQ